MLIDAVDAANAAQTTEIETEEELEGHRDPGRSPLSLPNIYLGTPQGPCSIDSLQQRQVHNSAPKNFVKQLQKFLSAQPDAGKQVALQIQLSTKV